MTFLFWLLFQSLNWFPKSYYSKNSSLLLSGMKGSQLAKPKPISLSRRNGRTTSPIDLIIFVLYYLLFHPNTFIPISTFELPFLVTSLHLKYNIFPFGTYDYPNHVFKIHKFIFKMIVRVKKWFLRIGKSSNSTFSKVAAFFIFPSQFLSPHKVLFFFHKFYYLKFSEILPLTYLLKI